VPRSLCFFIAGFGFLLLGQGESSMTWTSLDCEFFFRFFLEDYFIPQIFPQAFEMFFCNVAWSKKVLRILKKKINSLKRKD
jgi:hypothetical protein